MLVVYMYRHTSFGQVLAQQGGMSLGWLGAHVWLRAAASGRSGRELRAAVVHGGKTIYSGGLGTSASGNFYMPGFGSCRIMKLHGRSLDSWTFGGECISRNPAAYVDL
jgi:hypothetical protein